MPRLKEAVVFAPTFTAAATRRRLGSLVRGIVVKKTAHWEPVVAECVDAFERDRDTDLGRLAICLSLLRDLHGQGWSIGCSRKGLHVVRPDVNVGGAHRRMAQADIRQALQASRDRQLEQPSVRSFVQRMTSEKRGASTLSVHRLMRDGVELAGALMATTAEADSGTSTALARIVRPYLQFVEPGVRDEWTGHRLTDIWRYFRHTWLTPYRTTPGRSLMMLVRDAALEPHPVVGIAALASPIVRLGNRDRAAGLDPSTMVESLRHNATDEDVTWLLGKLAEQIARIYAQDYQRLGLLSEDELTTPTAEVIEALVRQAARIAPSSAKEVVHGERWTRLPELQQEAESPLFSKKRAVALASLLGARLLLRPVASAGTGTSLRDALCRSEVRNAVERLLRALKNDRSGTSMMDINVCGAVAPYNELLGGKLVALLMLSPQVRAYYSQKYGDADSVIASRMAGRPVRKSAELVMLTTSGIFPGRSSQYNRLSIPASAFGGGGAEVRFAESGATESYSTIHLSDQTVRLIQASFELEQHYRHVNSRFGEGVSPRLRKVRQQLDNMGLDSDELLKTGHARTTYVIHLCHNSAAFLMGKSDTPEYILPGTGTAEDTEVVAEFWRSRWLASRVHYTPALRKAMQHNIRFPFQHGASVKLPVDGVQPSFDELGQSWAMEEDEQD